jgi:hypothetical protein
MISSVRRSEMKRLTSIRSAIAFSLCSLLLGATVAQSADISLQQSIDLLVKGQSKGRAERIKPVLARANEEPAFRTQLIDGLTGRIDSYREDYRGVREIKALRQINAIEALPFLRKRWEKIAKKTYYLEWADPRIQLLETIAQFLPETERVQFLIDTERDKQEAPKVRFRATILLFASGNDKGIRHLLSAYEQSQREHSRTVHMSAKRQAKYPPMKEEWDQDADMMTDYIERGMLLNTSNKDTDGDGIVDGNDRNPLCAPREEKTSVKDIAQLLFYLHTRSARAPCGPFPFKVWIVKTVDNHDGKGVPSMFDGIELTGVDGVVLHMGPEQIKKYRSIHGYGTPIIRIHEVKGSNKSEREFRFTEYIAPEGAAVWRIRVKCFNGVWLPVHWEMTMIA